MHTGISKYMCIYIYIYTQRERERERKTVVQAKLLAVRSDQCCSSPVLGATLVHTCMYIACTRILLFVYMACLGFTVGGGTCG